MTPRQKRMGFVAVLVVGVSIAVGLAIKAFNENMLYFFSPSDIKSGKAPDDHSFRVGGLVVEGSVLRDSESLKINFDLTDSAETVTVQYEGILPDLFREGQGIVATGKITNGVFVADQVLAKHDENYMPPEVAESLKKAEMWKHMGEQQQGAAR